MPLVRSSSSRNLGSWVRKMPISRFRFCPCETSAARTCSLPSRWTCFRISRARGWNSSRTVWLSQNRVGWGVGACKATTMFSSTVRLSKTLEIWKERESPLRTIWFGGRPVMGSPNSSTVPSVGCRTPDRQLKSVVLPAPLGPRMAWISPSSTDRSTPSSARKPRKLRATPLAAKAMGTSNEYRVSALRARRYCRRPMRLQGKTALVTGAASGLGLGIARAFAQEGAKICVADVNAKGAEAAARELSGMAVTMDVTDERQVDAGVRACVRELGSVD